MNQIKTIIIITLLTQFAFASEPSDSTAQMEKGLMFQVTGLVSLRGFDGGTITYKKMLSQDAERRYALTVSSQFSVPASTTDRTYYYAEEDSTATYSDLESLITTSRFSLSVSRANITHFNRKKTTHAYMGWGPSISISYSGSNSLRERVPHDVVEYTQKSYSGLISVGAIGITGAEWRINESFSLLAEYQTSGSLRFNVSKSERTYEYENGNTSSDINTTRTPYVSLSSTTKLGLTIWF